MGAQLDVCPTEGLPWLGLDGPWLGLGVGVWLGLGEGNWEEGCETAAVAEEEEEGRKGGGHSRDPDAPIGPGGPGDPYRPIGAGGEEMGDKSHWSRVSTMRTASCLS